MAAYPTELMLALMEPSRITAVPPLAAIRGKKRDTRCRSHQGLSHFLEGDAHSGRGKARCTIAQLPHCLASMHLRLWLTLRNNHRSEPRH